MTVVIDVGCAKHGGDESIPDLVREFHPELLFGFDPATRSRAYELDGTTVLEAAVAAWTYDGEIGFIVSGLGGHVQRKAEEKFPCIDLARYILHLHADTGEKVILKMDAEGAEYTLLPHLVNHDADLALSLAWIEFHCAACGLGGVGDGKGHRLGCRGSMQLLDRKIDKIKASMRCEVRGWNR